MSLKEWSDLYGEENDGSFTLRRLSPSEKWCDRCNCYVDRKDAKRWTADGSFTHYLCPGCDTELWEPESNEELYTAEEIAEAKSRRTQRALDSGEVLPPHKHVYIDGYCACGSYINRRRQ